MPFIYNGEHSIVVIVPERSDNAIPKPNNNKPVPKNNRSNSEVLGAQIACDNAMISYLAQLQLNALEAIVKERLAYDLFMIITAESGINSSNKIILENVSGEIIELIPKVGEFLEVVKNIDNAFIKQKTQTAEVNVRYLVLLNIIKFPNAPITEAKLRSHGIKCHVKYPLHIKYRELICPHTGAKMLAK